MHKEENQLLITNDYILVVYLKHNKLIIKIELYKNNIKNIS